MERVIGIVRLCGWLFSLGVVLGGCTTTRPRKETPPPPAPEARRLQPRMWEGEQAKVVVMEFDNQVRLQPKGKNQVILDVFGKSMKRYLVKGLHQSEQFVVAKNAGTERVLQESDFTSSGQVKRKTLEQIGPSEGAEFLITGSVLTYQPSQESVAAGPEADPFFSEPVVAGGGSPTGTLAKKLFTNLPTARNDRIVIGLSLIDMATGKTIDSTIVEGTAQEFGAQNGRFFEEQLLRTSGSLQTPMQKALRVCTMKAVDWIAGTGLAYRRQVALRSPAPTPIIEKPVAAKKVNVRKKGEKEGLPSSQPAKKPDLAGSVVEKPIENKPIAEKALGEKPVAEKPKVEKTAPKKEVPQSEEWGQ